MEAIKKKVACLLVAAMLIVSMVYTFNTSWLETASEPMDLLPYGYARD